MYMQACAYILYIHITKYEVFAAICKGTYVNPSQLNLAVQQQKKHLEIVEKK